MATSTNFKVSNGVTTSTVSNLVGLNITDDNTLSNTDISYASNNLNIKNKNAAGSLILGTNNTTAVTIDSSQNVTIAGNLTVSGTTETVNSTVVQLQDPIMTLGGTTAPTSNDSKDRGIEFRWHNGTSAKTGFFGYDNSTGYLTFIPDGTNTSEVYSGTMGDIQATNFRGALIGNASTATTLATARNIAVAGDISGTASFNGSADISITTTLPNVATAGTYQAVTVNAKGLVTGGTNPTTLSGFGITDAAPIASPTFTGTVTTPTITTTGTTGLTLNNGTSNFIIFGANGFAAPTVTTRSVGTKLVICNNLTGSNVDVALGVGANNGMWFSTPNSGTDFKWYAGTTNIATLSGAAYLTLAGGTIETGGATGLFLNNGSSNIIKFSNAGVAAPSFTTRSAGTKIVFYDSVTASQVDYAMGVSSGTLWSSVYATGGQFQWFGGTTLAGTLTGAGRLTLTENLYASDITAQRAGAAPQGYVYLGNSGTKYIGYDGTNIVAQGANFYSSGTITGAGSIISTSNLETTNGSIVSRNGNIFSRYETATTGTYYFGNNGTRYLTCDGVKTYTFGPNGTSQNVASFSDLAFTADHGSFTAYSATSGAYGASISFYRQAGYAAHFGLNSSNQFQWGGWSMGTAATLDASGNFTAAGNVTAYSDERLKTNIKTIDSALDKTKALRGVEYDRIDSGSHEIGVIAQEIQKIIPEVVLEGKDEDKTLSVDYGKLVGLLIEAIKELDAKVEANSSTITSTPRQGA